MGEIRDKARTRERILEAAKRVFAARGFEAATLSEVGRAAGASKQLVQHHFGSKEALFRQVHHSKFRPDREWQEPDPGDFAELLAERFLKRAQDADYTRVLTWEAASNRRDVPGRNARKRRQAEMAAVLKRMQKERKLARDVDHRLVQLAIVALTTYPLAFGQNTEIVTGRSPADPRFQRAWADFLKVIGARLFVS